MKNKAGLRKGAQLRSKYEATTCVTRNALIARSFFKLEGNRLRNRGKHKVSLWRRLLWIAGAGMLIGLIWFGYTQWKIGGAGYANFANSSKPTEVGIVLGASLWRDKPSPALQERLDLSLELYEQGKFEYFIVTGGKDRPNAQLSEAEGMANYLIEHGVEPSRIEMEKHATSTLENLKFSQDIMKEKGWKSATIMTHDFHGARAYEIADALGYEQPELKTTGSKVLFLPWHRTRESLAYTKWKWDELWLR